MKGLGDLIAKFTQSTGIDKVAKFVLGEDCGCDERQEYLNKLLPFEDKDKILARDFVNMVHKQGRLSAVENGMLWDLYRKYINPRAKTSTCSSCVRNAIKQLKQKLDEV